MLDLTPLEKALTSLERAIERAKKPPQDEEMNLRNGGYWKTLKFGLNIEDNVISLPILMMKRKPFVSMKRL